MSKFKRFYIKHFLCNISNSKTKINQWKQISRAQLKISMLCPLQFAIWLDELDLWHSTSHCHIYRKRLVSNCNKLTTVHNLIQWRLILVTLYLFVFQWLTHGCDFSLTAITERSQCIALYHLLAARKISMENHNSRKKNPYNFRITVQTHYPARRWHGYDTFLLDTASPLTERPCCFALDLRLTVTRLDNRWLTHVPPYVLFSSDLFIQWHSREGGTSSKSRRSLEKHT